MEDASTEALRKLAPNWTLAGDEQLLTILQNTHQKLLAKCVEANSQLEQMATVLNDASISLQSVNNRFMALSSSQFIESRVYDDDDLAIDIPEVKEPPKAEIPDELTCLKHSLAVLESAHEVMTILRDSDTDSDTDDDMPHSAVLKPKDMYAHRPLPYIIGSQPWKNKWHAGLVVEDSDSDSSTSKPERDSEQYSQSEPEDMQTDRLHVSDTHDTTVSETSSELPSEQGSVPKPTPADVANQIAKRLGAKEPPRMDREPEYDEPAKPTVRKLYRPQDPITSTIFRDEPPPLSGSDSEADIFADLHRGPPALTVTQQGRSAADDLFDSRDDSDADIFNDFRNQPTEKPTSLFDAGPTPHMFNKKPAHPSDDRPHTYDTPHINPESRPVTEDRGVKKPVGGISLFGNKGTESIGAAILKRNQQKSSSDNDSETDKTDEQHNETNKQEKDIFDDLFARSEGKKVTNKTDLVQDIKKEIKKKNEVTKVDKPKVDLFSDNLFDDIDDIFTNNVVKKPPKENSKATSIFEDDDDLFSDIAASKTMKIEVASSSNKKSLFDSDDDLFSDDVKPKQDVTAKINQVTKVIENPENETNFRNKEKATKSNETAKILKETTRSLFDDDEDDIFSDLKINKPSIASEVQPSQRNQSNLLTNNKIDHLEKPKSSVFNSPSLFDDDDDDSELFAEPNKPKAVNSIDIEKKITEPEIDKKENLDMNIDIPNSSKPVVEQSEARNKEDSKIDIVTTIVNNNNKVVTSEQEHKDYISNVSENVDRNLNTVKNTAANISDHIKTIQQSSSDSDDDFEQDFDDLPPKGVINKNLINVVTEAEPKQVPVEKDNIFDNNTLHDDIFTKPENSQPIFKSNESIENNQFEKTDKDNTNKEFIPNNVEADIFSDILTEPPAFEKPKEPKKSKNVNALFDDDSDDESLFFKKNDVITDEKPEDFKPPQDTLFGIFTDEPPDDGFSKISDDLDYDMFNTLPKPKIPQQENLPPIPSTEDFEHNLPAPISENKIAAIDSDDDIFRTFPKKEKTPKTSIVDALKLDKDETLESNTENIPESHIKDESTKILGDYESPKKETDISISKRIEILSDIDDIFSPPKFKESNAVTTPTEKDEPEPMKQESSNTTSDDELFKSSPKQEIESKGKQILKEDSRSDDDLFKIPKSKDATPHSEIEEKSVDIPEKSEPKKVGKLKVGININVNALLPGASPKKVKPNDQTDGHTQSQNQTPETKLPENQNPDSILKSVSFDGKPDSEVLDNKISKERAKIQVKRRPSTRKARKEAVRKSAIDFGEDSTDNSSSVDDPPRILAKNQPEVHKKDNIEDTSISNLDIDTQSKNTEILSQNAEVKVQQPESSKQVERQITDITEKPTFSKDVKSKVVYILNDEDIFNTKPIEKSDSSKVTTESKNSENLGQNTDSNAGVTTLGKVYNKSETKIDDLKHKKSSLFDDDDDEKIFKGKSIEKKTNIFDSDSEGELFGITKKVERRKETIKEVKRDVKASLFGDDDDDDNLFGVEPKKSAEPAPQSSRSTVKDSVSTEPVFEDPLSMFGDDD